MAYAEKRPTGWRAVYRDSEGRKRVAGYAPTKKAALELAQKQEHAIAGDAWVDPDAGTLTLSSYFEVHWRPAKIGELTTLAYYDSMWSAIEPEFGHMELKKILPSTVQNWVKRQAESGVTPGTIKARVKALQTILAGKKAPSALIDRLIVSNPCAAVQLPTVPERDVEIFLPHEIDKLLEVLDPWWLPLIGLDIDSGIRWGELMGLMVMDFKIGFREFQVNRTIVEVSKKRTGLDDRFQVKSYPKGKIRRRIAVSDDVAEMIEQMVADRNLGPEDRLFSMPDKTPPPEWEEGDELFWTPVRTEAWPGGLPIGRSYFRTAIWLNALTAAGLERRRFHDLRASNISWLLSETKNTTMVMERAGHREFATTARYQAAMEEASRDAVKALRKARKKDAKRHAGQTRTGNVLSFGKRAPKVKRASGE